VIKVERIAPMAWWEHWYVMIPGILVLWDWVSPSPELTISVTAVTRRVTDERSRAVK
jgi:hypothetical protein